jgi:hypothetical protein
MAESACQALKARMSGKAPWQMVQRAVFRCIAEWEGKGATRTIYEEMNLAVHAGAASALAAECIVTCPHSNFYAVYFLEIVERAISDGAAQLGKRVESAVVSGKAGTVRRDGKLQALAYAHRRLTPDLMYLSPWEFVHEWEIIEIEPPPQKEAGNAKRGFTEWRSEDAKAEVKLGVRQVPGIHFVVREPEDNETYVTFPEISTDSHFRHLWVLLPRRCPHVPVVKNSPMPTMKMDKESRAKLLCVYFRPWTLLRGEAQSRSLPYAGTLNFAPLARRKTGKQALEGARSFSRAWKWYVRGHVVSRSAARLITQALMQIPADSKEEPEADKDASDPEPEPLPADAHVALSPTDLRGLLRGKGTDANATADVISKEVRSAMAHGHGLWDRILSSSHDAGRRVPKGRTFGNWEELAAKLKTGSAARGGVQVPRMVTSRNGKPSGGGGGTEPQEKEIYPPRTRQLIHSWRASLETRDFRPDGHQLEIIDAVVSRCGDEAVALKKDAVSRCRGEPMLAMVHGFPGSGKSEVIKWLRELFMDQLGWQHGVEFICAAPMWSMAAHIQGVSVHNVGGLQINLQPGLQPGGKRDGSRTRPNALYTKLQNTRWLIIDEIENVSVELLVSLEKQIGDSSRQGTRSFGTRRDGSRRLFGGLNVIFVGDFWQVPPVRMTSITANPFAKHTARAQRILHVFWGRDDQDALTHRYILETSRWGVVEKRYWTCSPLSSFHPAL